MAAMFALVSGTLLGMTPLLIVDAIGRHRLKEVSFFTVMTIVAALACYSCLNELPDAHGHRWYWNAACVFGVLVIGFFTAWTLSSATHKKKR